jgi:hypothetical protein
LKWLLLALAVASLHAAPGARLLYSKSFPNSLPAYFQVTLQKDGAAEYAEAVDDTDPLRFKLSEGEAAEIFGLAERLGFFNRPLETSRKVAFMGAKTLRYEDGERKSEVKFNFSEDSQAQAIVEWFERMGQAARDRIELERAARFDKLGVYPAVLALQSDINRKRVAALDQFLPILDKIAGNEAYMHTARQRAAEMADSIRKGAR